MVIPAYNQAEYLSDAIQSVLAQSYWNYEIIVVDDGSTDDTAAIARRFGAAVRYVYQENQGLAGARNTGILHGQGEYVALLDADDLWLPSFLTQMVALAAGRPEAALYYCGVCYMDAAGRELPQPGAARIVPAGAMYMAILRANFLIPSAVMLRRSVVEENLFDVAFRRLQDWELWVRLLRQGYTFAGRTEELVRYRVHGTSLSTDPSGGQQAAKALLEKHFGPDDEEWQRWPADKRRAYGGFYRFCALIPALVRRGDWQACATYLRRAFQVDPSLAVDLDLFYDLVLGTQPPGQRGALDQLDLGESARNIHTLLHAIFLPPIPPVLMQLRRLAHGTAYYALGLVAYNAGQRSLSRSFLLQALRLRPGLWRDSLVIGNLLKSFLSRGLLAQLKHYRIQWDSPAKQTTKVEIS